MSGGLASTACRAAASGARCISLWDSRRVHTGEPWLPVSDSFPEINVEAERRDPHSFLSLHKRLIELRRAHPALARGAYLAAPASGDLHFGPHRVLANISLDFDDHAGLAEVEETTARLERAIKERFPDIAHVFVEAQAHETQTGPRFGAAAPRET